MGKSKRAFLQFLPLKTIIDCVILPYSFCRVILLKSAKPWLRLPIVYHLSSISSVEKDYLRTMKGFTEQVSKKVTCFMITEIV